MIYWRRTAKGTHAFRTANSYKYTALCDPAINVKKVGSGIAPLRPPVENCCAACLRAESEFYGAQQGPTITKAQLLRQPVLMIVNPKTREKKS
jgi:hypothetical protein